MHQRIAIVGGGFCGTILAVNLLRRPPRNPTELLLIERRESMGRGVAYAVHDVPYLLNVPAGRLSAESLDPPAFLRFARRSLPDADAEDFLPRQLYGDYLEDCLARAEREASPQITLSRVVGEVSRLTRTAPLERPTQLTKARLWRAEFSENSPGPRPSALDVDRVVLALGNPPPGLQPWASDLVGHPAYHDDPRDLPSGLHAAHTVLIVGNGLTMADAVFALSREPTRAPKLMTISRRGLTPLPQTTFVPTALRGNGAALLECADSARRLLAVSRALARDVDALGGDWREVVTFLRNLAPALWQRMPPVERRRFLRHLQSHWDVHRHRLPPQLTQRLDWLRRSGALRVHAGRIDAVGPAGHRLRVSWRPRGHGPRASCEVDALINATGPDYRLARTRNPLLRSLHADGLIGADPLQLGIETTPLCECIDTSGSISEQLYYVGPMLRATHWEATAATELRQHAEQLARHLTDAGRA